ncbi:MAG: hypothetical protein ACOY6K_12475 [Pseudomonadota bacterium]
MRRIIEDIAAERAAVEYFSAAGFEVVKTAVGDWFAHVDDREINVTALVRSIFDRSQQATILRPPQRSRPELIVSKG